MTMEDNDDAQCIQSISSVVTQETSVPLPRNPGAHTASNACCPWVNVRKDAAIFSSFRDMGSQKQVKCDNGSHLQLMTHVVVRVVFTDPHL